MRPTLLDPKELSPHEDVIETVLKKRIAEVLESPYIYPIIVEKDHKIVLDGHHRWYTFLQLGRRVPAYLVSYSDVVLESWSLKVRPNFIVEKDGKLCVDDICSDDFFAFYWTVYTELARWGLDPLEVKSAEGVLKLPKLSKEEVIRATKEGYVYPPKTTRHIINFNVEPVKNAT